MLGTVLLFGALAAGGPASARDVSVRGQPMPRFGRIELTFDQPTKVTARADNGVLVVSFGAATKVKSEKLASELPTLVSVVRIDPDGTGLRAALAGPVRVSVLDAGERVFVDLLPPNWTGLLPSLPPEVVADLAERARVAEEKLRKAERRVAEAPKPVKLRLAILPTLTRLVLEPPPGTPIRFDTPDGGTAVAFDGALVLDEGGEKPRIAPGIASYESVKGPDGLTIRLRPAPGFAVRTFREGDAAVIDLARPTPARALPEPAPEKPPARAESPPAAPMAGASQTAAAQPQAPGPQADVAVPMPALAPAPLVPRLEGAANARSLVLPFRTATPAAAFLRGGRLTAVFDTRDTIDPAFLSGVVGDAVPVEAVDSQDGFVVLRFGVPARGPVRLLPEGSGWRIAFGDVEALPSDPVRITRGSDASGQDTVVAGLAGVAAAHWLKEPDGARLAVVTASGRPQALSIGRGFVEFDLPATLQGLAVEARADDLSVGLGPGGVTIGRPAGLSLSSAALARVGGEPSPAANLVLSRTIVGAEQTDGVGERYRDLVSAAAAAPRSGRAESRFRLARFLVANGLDHEGASVLALARGEDPVFARRREATLLSGIAAVRAGHLADGRRLLEGEGLADDPEAVLWRAMADAGLGRPAPALAGFRRSAEILDLYPDALVGPIRLSALRAALAVGDTARAEAELTALDRLATGSVAADHHDLARAEVDEAAGRSDAALRSFEVLAATADGRPRAEAELHAVRLGTAAKSVKPEDAIRRLEVLAAAWRGDAVELGTLVELARRYAAERRWREMFAVARTASRFFPDDEQTRALYDETARQFEHLLLAPGGEALSAIDALSLYFDFRELAPVGRRGDEMVRRLADRLVELDLLDQAADLLQHQVDKRLSGAARATVAARLAAIRLMSGKPIMAVATLQSTRMAELPERSRRLRMLLEARAQADLTRTDLALEMLDGETGPEAARLRTAILWNARRWKEAGEAAEQLAGTAWQGPLSLTDGQRRDVLRAATAFQLGSESLGLGRLASKFAAKMFDSADASAFALLMRPDAKDDPAFRRRLREVEAGDTLRDMLAMWKGSGLPVTSAADEPAPAAESAPAPDEGGRPRADAGPRSPNGRG